jgi:hypothetical protein
VGGREREKERGVDGEHKDMKVWVSHLRYEGSQTIKKKHWKILTLIIFIYISVFNREYPFIIHVGSTIVLSCGYIVTLKISPFQHATYISVTTSLCRLM